MNKILRVFAHLFFVVGLLIIIVLPSNKYSWMQEMDPTVVVDDTSDNRLIFSIVVLAVIVLTEFWIFIRTASSVEKKLSLVLAFLAISIWSVKYMILPGSEPKLNQGSHAMQKVSLVPRNQKGHPNLGSSKIILTSRA